MAESKGLAYLRVITESPQKKTYTFALITVAVVLILSLGAIRPTIATMLRINNEITEKKLIDEQLDTKIRNLTTLSNQYLELEDQFYDLKLIFPTQGNFSLFMTNIEEITRNNGLSLAGINFNSPGETDVKTKTLEPWTARLTVTGSRANLVPYLQDLERMPNYPTVNQVSFSNTLNDLGTNSFNVELLIYRIDDLKFYDR